jgi:DNA-binding MarR family transcriptional regulator
MTHPPFDPDHDPADRRLVTGLAKIGLALKTQAWKGANTRGLSPTQAQILSLLSRNSERTQRLSELAEALGVTAATTSDAVRSLTEKALVTKTRDPHNARALAISLTDEGRTEASRNADWPDFMLTAVETLSNHEQSVFLRGLIKILRTLQLRDQIPVSAMCLTCRYFRPNVHLDSRRPHHCAFVDAAFGDASLRLECDDHQTATLEQAQRAWDEFNTAPAP